MPDADLRALIDERIQYAVGGAFAKAQNIQAALSNRAFTNGVSAGSTLTTPSAAPVIAALLNVRASGVFVGSVNGTFTLASAASIVCQAVEFNAASGMTVTNGIGSGTNAFVINSGTPLSVNGFASVNTLFAGTEAEVSGALEQPFAWTGIFSVPSKQIALVLEISSSVNVTVNQLSIAMFELP